MKNAQTVPIIIIAVIVVAGVLYFLSGSSPTPSVIEEAQMEESGKDTDTSSAPSTKVSQPKTTTPTAPAAPTTPAPTSEPTPQITYQNTSEQDIFVVLPKPGQKVTPSITVSGAARGDWFYRGVFWAEVVAPNGDVLVRNEIPSKGNANTTGMLQFSSFVLVTSNYRGPATVVLINDNPVGHPIPDRSVSIPVVIE